MPDYLRTDANDAAFSTDEEELLTAIESIRSAFNFE